MTKKGYIFVGTNRLNVNAFFVNKNYIDKIKINIPKLDDLSLYTNAKFQLTGNKDKNETDQVQVYDIKNKKMKRFCDAG